MNCCISVEIDATCRHCGEPMCASRHYHGYSGEYEYYSCCSAACFVERGLEDDDTSKEITLEEFLEMARKEKQI